MAHLFDEAEAVPAACIPGLPEELAPLAPPGTGQRGALQWAAGLKVIDPQPTTRARLLADLAFSDEMPNPITTDRQLFSGWIEPGSPPGLAALRAMEPDGSCPVLIDSQLWSVGALVADWAWFLEHFAAAPTGHLGWHTVVVPRDCRWILATGMEEHVQVVSPSFARIRSLTFSPQTQVGPGLIVPKAQCRVGFDDGSWLSGRIYGADPRHSALAFLRFLSARAGAAVTEVPIMPLTAPAPGGTD